MNLPARSTLIAVILRSIALVFIIVAIALTALGPGVICQGSQCASRNYLSMDVTYWDYLNGHYRTTKLIGQYFTLAVEVILGLAIIALIIYRLWKGTSRIWLIEFIVLIIGIFLLLIVGGLECWYASGYTVMDHSEGNWDFTINGWVAAAAFLFLTAIVFAIDAIFVMKYTKS